MSHYIRLQPGTSYLIRINSHGECVMHLLDSTDKPSGEFTCGKMLEVLGGLLKSTEPFMDFVWTSEYTNVEEFLARLKSRPSATRGRHEAAYTHSRVLKRLIAYDYDSHEYSLTDAGKQCAEAHRTMSPEAYSKFLRSLLQSRA